MTHPQFTLMTRKIATKGIFGILSKCATLSKEVCTGLKPQIPQVPLVSQIVFSSMILTCTLGGGASCKYVLNVHGRADPHFGLHKLVCSP